MNETTMNSNAKPMTLKECVDGLEKLFKSYQKDSEFNYQLTISNSEFNIIKSYVNRREENIGCESSDELSDCESSDCSEYNVFGSKLKDVKRINELENLVNKLYLEIGKLFMKTIAELK